MPRLWDLGLGESAMACGHMLETISRVQSHAMDSGVEWTGIGKSSRVRYPHEAGWGNDGGGASGDIPRDRKGGLRHRARSGSIETLAFVKEG